MLKEKDDPICNFQNKPFLDRPKGADYFDLPEHKIQYILIIYLRLFKYIIHIYTIYYSYINTLY